MDYSNYKKLEFRRKVWVVAGAQIEITDPAQKLVGFIKMKAWKLREDIRIFTDKSMQTEVLRIRARQIIDFGATYDVCLEGSDQVAFSLQRKGMKSTFVRDHWNLLDAQGNQFAELRETSSELALMRRWLGFIPFVGPIVDIVFMFLEQEYQIVAKDTAGAELIAATITRRKNPFVVKMTLDTEQAQVTWDPRIAMAATSLLSIIEAAKN